MARRQNTYRAAGVIQRLFSLGLLDRNMCAAEIEHLIEPLLLQCTLVAIVTERQRARSLSRDPYVWTGRAVQAGFD